ncbi:MAG: Eco57I restriction-modification methylase domain-containing protein, partial [Candidatus Altiarchaeota archaeon]|nr:Eco57I restriction-modification methylase domain-containing protein [Candidatus Altiarchaeota archaeon]
VYEQFLGKVIRLTPSHRAMVEEKPEVKKAGGVYYTPKYIVEYIVENTIGKLIKGKTPKHISSIKMLDPACGSGSFLIGAYTYLLNYHRDWYVNHNPEKHQKEVYQGKGGQWYLTLDEKKRILLNNIYGVDIDGQAVEVTKLNLLLKVLEDEHREPQKRLLGRVLPDLHKNIKCGNSLIDPDFYACQKKLLSDEEQYRINAFDWDKEFPFKFDAVIGNPPYLNIDDTWGKGDVRLKAIKSQYPHIYNDKTDILLYFLAKAAKLSKGYCSFIVSRAFLEAYKADKLRKFLLESSAIREIIDFRNFYVFPRVGITTCILRYCPGHRPDKINIFQLLDKKLASINLSKNLKNHDVFDLVTISQKRLDDEPWTFASDEITRLNEKIDSVGMRLGDFMIIGQGMQTGRNKVFGKRTKEEMESWGLTKKMSYKRASNSDIQQYHIRDRGEYLLYLENMADFNRLPKKLQGHLLSHKNELKKRAAYQRGDCEWWKYTWPLHKEHYNRKRILCPYLSTFNRFALDSNDEFLSLTDTTVIFENNQDEKLYYLLALLNSKLLTFRFRTIGKLKSGGIYEYFWNSISKLPIKKIDFSDTGKKKSHDEVVLLVSHIHDLYKRLDSARTPDEKERIERQIDATDKQIDQLVYQLYGLTDGEIKIVEGFMLRGT